MSDKRSDDILLDLLGPDPAESEALPALPNVDQRAEMFLRAIGGEREFTPAEHALARERILDEMAASLLDVAPEGEQHDASRATSQVPAGLQAGRADPANSVLARFQSASKRVLENLARDLLYPFVSGATLRSTQLRYAAPLALLVIAGGAWTGAWFYAAHTVEKGFDVAAELNARNGVTYACASRTTGGFPFAVEFHCAAPAGTVVAQNRTFAIKAAEVLATASVLSPGSVRGEITGPVTITEGGQAVAFADGELGFDQDGRLDGMLKFTTTPANLQRLAADLGNGDRRNADQVAQLAPTYLRLPSDTDNASPAKDEPDFGGQPIVDVPLRLSAGAVSIGTLPIGRLPSLFGGDGSKAGERK